MQSKLVWRTSTVAVRANTDIELVGSVRNVGADSFRWVENKDVVALALGQAAYHKLSDGATFENSVYQCLTANLTCLAGIVCATDGIDSTGSNRYSFGWVQIFGNNGSISVSGATTGGTDIASGEFLKGANAVSHLVRDSTAPTYRRTVQILAAVTTTTTPAAGYKRGFIYCI